MPVPVVIRPVRPGEHRLAADVFRSAIMYAPYSDGEWERAEPSWTGAGSWAAWDGDDCIGHAGYYRFDTFVPGGRSLPTAGLTRVGVLPTHTRRGALTQLLTTLLRSARDEGRPLANLRATEAVIYGRFGFGVSSESEVVEIDPRRARPVAGVAPGARRLVPRSRWLEVVPPLYDRLATTRPGAISRPEWMWARYLEDGLDGSQAQQVVVHTSVDGVDDGFAHYSLHRVEEPTGWPWGRLEVWDLWGANPQVELALWEHMLAVDLVTVVRVEECPRDLSLRAAAADPRACTVRIRYDDTWLRLLDVQTALAARTYNPGPPITLAVTDPLFPDNCGRWRVSGDGAERIDGDTSAPADLVTGIAGLSSAYLGSSSWWEQAVAGRAHGSTPDAVARADALFVHRPFAFCGSHF